MLTNTTCTPMGQWYENRNRANIPAYGIESEANKGVGLLLRSNDSAWPYKAHFTQTNLWNTIGTRNPLALIS